jgi:Kef-type K+ transport system membrane component KefB
MTSDIFTQLSLVIVVGALVSLAMRLLKQPLIMGYIFTGIIVGPSVLNIIHDTNTFATFSTIGITLLLFIIGLGLNTRVIKEAGRVVVVAGLVQLVFTGVIAFAITKLLHFTNVEGLFISVALTFSSTIIIVKLLNDHKEQSRLYGKITIGILLIQDIAATLALLFLAAGHGQSTVSASSLVWLFIKGAALVGVLSLISTKILPRVSKLVAGSQEFLFLFALGWGLGIAVLFEKAGFSIEVGALIAGISLAPLPYCHEIAARLKPLRDFFVVVFFIALGEGFALHNLGSVLLPAIILSLTVIVVKPVIVLSIMGLMGYTRRTSFKTAITLGQVSEFSLVFMVLAASSGFVSQKFAALITLIALITIAISTYLMLYADSIFMKLEPLLTPFEYRKARAEHESRHHYDMVLFGYKKGGAEFVRVFKSMHKPFVVIDYDPEVIETLEQHKIHYLYGDATDLELLDEAGIDKAKLIVSTMTDHATNMFLVHHLSQHNPQATIVCHSDSVSEATELYEQGATYVMLPHYIGSEKMGSFIRRNGLKKAEFKHYREKHLLHLQSHSE